MTQVRYDGGRQDRQRHAPRRLAALLCVLSVLLTAACSSSSGASTKSKLTLVAASSLTGTFTKLQSIFEKQHPGVSVVVSFGSSTTLAEQVVAGAPADVIATADKASIGIVSQKHLLSHAPVKFATNTMAIVTPPDNPAGVHSVQDLSHADFVMCDLTAPCGAAAQMVLRAAGVTNRARSLEVDVKSVLSKVTLGEADAGLVYVTDAQAAGKSVATIAIPANLNTVNPYYIAPVKGSGVATLAKQWVSFVTSLTGQKVLRAAKFGPP